MSYSSSFVFCMGDRDRDRQGDRLTVGTGACEGAWV